MKEQPSYYAILTADVRYDKNLSANAKLLFAEITALTQKEGFAWASNRYFAELYGVEKDTVSRWVSELVKSGYIKIEVDRKAGNLRKITIRKNAEGIRKKEDRYTQKRHDPIRKNADIILQENNKKNSDSGSYERPVAKNQDFRGQDSPAKERLRELVKSGKLGELKNA